MSIHDVAPVHRDAVVELWDLCRRSGFVPALLVVPDWHGAAPLGSHPSFVEWIRERNSEGAELILHGLRHDEAGLSRTLRDERRAFGRTAREGEFLTLDFDAARTRIEAGMTALQSLGLEPSGFIPPAWLAREGTHEAVRDVGLLFSEDQGGVRVHTRRERIPAPAMRWSGRTPVRAVISVGLAALRRIRYDYGVPFHSSHSGDRSNAPLSSANRPGPRGSRGIIRLALHPQDLGHPYTAASVRREVARWSMLCDQLRYDQL